MQRPAAAQLRRVPMLRRFPITAALAAALLLSCAPAPVNNASVGSAAAAGRAVCSLTQLPPYDRPCDQVCAAEGAQCPGPASSSADPAPGCTEPAAGSPFYMCRCCAVSPITGGARMRRPAADALAAPWPCAQVDGETTRARRHVRRECTPAGAVAGSAMVPRIGTPFFDCNGSHPWQRGPYFLRFDLRHVRQQSRRHGQLQCID